MLRHVSVTSIRRPLFINHNLTIIGNSFCEWDNLVEHYRFRFIIGLATESCNDINMNILDSVLLFCYCLFELFLLFTTHHLRISNKVCIVEDFQGETEVNYQVSIFNPIVLADRATACHVY